MRLMVIKCNDICRRPLHPKLLENQFLVRMLLSSSSIWMRTVSMSLRCLCIPGWTCTSAPLRPACWESCWWVHYSRVQPPCRPACNRRLMTPSLLIFSRYGTPNAADPAIDHLNKSVACAGFLLRVSLLFALMGLDLVFSNLVLW